MTSTYFFKKKYITLESHLCEPQTGSSFAWNKEKSKSPAASNKDSKGQVKDNWWIAWRHVYETKQVQKYIDIGYALAAT